MLAAVLTAAVLAALAVVTGVLLSRGDARSGPSTKPTVAVKVDSLQRIDPKTNKLVATIGLRPHPSGVAAGEGAVWVTNETDATLTRIDPKTNRVSSTAAAGSDPTFVAAGAGGVWVSNPNDGTLVRLDPHTLKIAHVFVPGGDASPYCGPSAVDQRAAWVLAGEVLVRINPENNMTSTVVGVPSCASHVAVAKGAIWLLAQASVDRVDPMKLEPVASIPIDFLPVALAADARGVWIADGQNSLTRIDANTNRIAATVRVGKSPFGVAIGEGTIWVANTGGGTVSRIDPGSGKVVATIRVGPSPSDIVVGEGAAWVLVHTRTPT